MSESGGTLVGVSGELARRSVMLIPRIPSTFVPSVVMPVFITIAFSGAFGAIASLPMFPTKQILDWIGPMAILQGAAFAGITTGMGIARDVEAGFFDRLLLGPSPRLALLAGPLLASMIRATLPFVMVLTVALIGGARLEDPVLGLLALFACNQAIALIAGAWSLGLVYRIRSTNAAPLMQVGLFISFFLSTAQVPLAVMTGWLHSVARINPMTNVLHTARQGFIDQVTWSGTWPGVVALAAMAAFLVWWAARGLARMGP